MNRINLICLGVADLKAALHFYKELGFQTPEKSEDPQIVFFNNKGTKLELFPIAELAKDMNLPEPSTKEKNSFNGITFAINVKSEADVDELIQKAKAVGGEIVKPPEKVFWGGYSGYFKDLDGYHWEVAYADSWKFDDQDMLVIE
ncbi:MULTISPECIES: VOC family protein [Carnobacterium]|uniref:VOC family protein n=1 Tax=Carnobacterium divergens TaxID=2748 RepID=A0A2R8A185_CARDV|nr:MULTISPECIES: VOC family protein [Carnobacterium]MCO6017671.1 VOC family protein [Carnobacterium divergens]MDT1938962.1 VOC family protein [Carnobacterium divergens]MDT1941400.1 VOC family protein [Carnobacterium divergens]MDT1947198.1 VOC family protein [Carnobacterium divergens]MDT1949636.1 VOC family protein [Carnobacterium divergens]